MQSPEEKDADTKRFVIKSFSIALVFIVVLFGYSIVFTEQPLFNEAPADKQIFGVLTLIGGQLLTILANYISKSTTSVPSTNTFCPPSPTVNVPTFAPKSTFGSPNERPPL
jgi:hypothetical protein